MIWYLTELKLVWDFKKSFINLPIPVSHERIPVNPISISVSLLLAHGKLLARNSPMWKTLKSLNSKCASRSSEKAVRRMRV